MEQGRSTHAGHIPSPARTTMNVNSIAAPPRCSIHPNSLVRHYRAHGPGGPGVYPQCVPADGAQPHLLAWNREQHDSTPTLQTGCLTRSEIHVLADAADGLTVVETATHLSKGSETVKTQRRSIIMKLGARNMAQAVGMATSRGLLTTEQAVA